MRYHDMERVDLDAMRRLVSTWLDEHTDGTLDQMASDLKVHYPNDPEDMAIVLRGIMAAELRRRTSPAPEVPQISPRQPARRGDHARSGGPR
jgi:hypothetical protein